MLRKAWWLNQVTGVRMCSFALFLAMLAWLPTARAAGAPEVIRIGTLPGLRYNTSVFSVRPGAEVELIFSNYDEMLHNLVITRPGARERVVQAALALGAGAADRDFVPPSEDVLWATKVVPSDESFTLTFTAPTTTGDYPYVCTMPGHGIVMFGLMTVTATPGPPVMTPVEPAEPTSVDHVGHGPGSRAAVMRSFMPDAGPASIAVQLPGNVSYVWDAGAGRFRYAWAGGGAIRPSSPERGLARITGEIFYREPAFHSAWARRQLPHRRTSNSKAIPSMPRASRSSRPSSTMSRYESARRPSTAGSCAGSVSRARRRRGSPCRKARPGSR